MADRVQLVLVIHNHQPVGNFDGVINEAFENAYYPFLSMLKEFPRIRIGLHTSGCLLEWLADHRIEYNVLVRELLDRGQLELLGGGMYEPILPVLPDRDALWQLKRMNQYLEQTFGITPTGMWCPERVWEPHLPALLAAAGLKYTLLDDYHFRGSVTGNAVATDYFMTEHAGNLVSLLPITKKLRYTIPFSPVEDTLKYLRELADDSAETPLVVFGDDGEKFGVWPDTFEWVYEKGWLRDFFTKLDANLDWIDLKLPAELLRDRRPAGKVFVPCMSYTEMGEWSRVDPDATEDDPPGFWRNYFHKYPEVNAMYHRMLYVSNLVAEGRRAGLPEDVVSRAEDDIGRAQCNCAYWHGIFGGLYLNYLRQAIHLHATAAERTLSDNWAELHERKLTVCDHDGLGWDQYVLRSDQLSCVVDPGRGLCISHLDYLPTQFCWSDVLARRREAYHHKILTADTTGKVEHASIHDLVILKEPDLEKKLLIDPHQRVGFTTYFTDLKSAEHLVAAVEPPEAEPRFSLPDYGIPVSDQQADGTAVSGSVDHGGFSLRKSIELDGHRLVLQIVHAGGVLPADLGRFVVEFNLTVLTDQAADRFLAVDNGQHPLARPGDWAGVTRCGLVDRWQQRILWLEAPRMRYLNYYPVRTVSSSESGFESTYQGSCLMLGFDPQALAAGVEITLSIDLEENLEMLAGEV